MRRALNIPHDARLATRQRRRPRRAYTGFTLIEVMVALAVMTISAMALMSMQGQAARANGHARDLTAAAQIAQTVIERLKMDALAWRSIVPGVNDITTTQWLNATGQGNPGDFITFTVKPPFVRGGNSVTISNAFNQFGEDVVVAGASADQLASVKFCTSLRLLWIYNTNRVLRADVRVWWTKEVPTRAILDDFASCADDNARLLPGGLRYNDYHTVYLSTVIRPQ
jgi:type II secretion system protein I